MENERLAKVEESNKVAHKRLDSLESKIENIYELTISVREIAQEMKLMREDVSKIDTRVNTLEEKPGKKWEDLSKTIITCTATAIAGYFWAKFKM